MSQVSINQKSVRDFIQLVLIDNIGHLVKTGNHYLGIGPQTQAIELLGAIIEDENVEAQQSNSGSEFETQRKSRRRFHHALKLFTNTNYVTYCPEFKNNSNYSVDYDLYENLRCGYAHQIRPLGKIVITTENETYDDGTCHLKIDPRTNALIIVSEFLYRDLKEVCEKVINMIDAGQINHSKPYQTFLEITSFDK